MLLLSSRNSGATLVMFTMMLTSAYGLGLSLLGHYAVTFSKNRDQRKRVLSGSCRLAAILLEEILKLVRYCTWLLSSSGLCIANRATLTDNFSDFITDRVYHSSLFPQSLLLSQISLEIVLSIRFQLSIKVIILELNPLLLLRSRAFVKLAPLMTTVKLLDDLDCICFFSLLCLVYLVKMSLCAHNAREDIFMKGVFIGYIYLLIYHSTECLLFWRLLYWHFVSWVFTFWSRQICSHVFVLKLRADLTWSGWVIWSICNFEIRAGAQAFESIV